MTPDTVRRFALKSIGNADSFIARSKLQLEMSSYVAEKKQTIIGVYVNGADSHIIVSDKGLTVVYSQSSEFIPYEQITHITSPIDGEQDLDLLLESDSLDDVLGSSIPIFGITDGIPDIDEFYNFLLDVTEYLRISPINLRSIRNMKDLAVFLKTECEWEEYTGALANYLENDFHAERFSRLKIDKEMLEKADFWRAVAVILDIPIRLPVEMVRDKDEWANSASFDE